MKGWDAAALVALIVLIVWAIPEIFLLIGGDS